MNFYGFAKRSAAGLALASSTVLLAGMIGTASAEDLGQASLQEPTSPVSIVYAGAAYSANDMKPVLDAFHKAHPNITVEYQAVPFNDFNSILSARLGRGDNTIDVFDVDMPRTNAYAARGWITDISTVFPKLDAEVDPGSLKAASVDGKLMAMPYQTSTNVFYYNKTLLKKAGIAFPSAKPEDRLTWEAVTEQAAKAKQAGAKWGLVFDQIDRYYQLEPLPVSAGGEAGGKGDGNLTPDVANDGWVKAFSWYGKLFADGLSPRGVQASETPDLFASGQIAFYPGGPWWAPMFEKNADLDFGIAPYPAFAGGKPATPTGGWSLGLNPNSDKASASLIFMKFMGIDNGGYAQFMTALAVPPSNLKGADKFYSSAAFADKRMAGVVDLMKYELANTSILRLQTVGYIEFEDVMTRTFSDIINGADAGKALSAANDELDSAWDKFR
jgi:multiple sugar transport system substrate-binding protein